MSARLCPRCRAVRWPKVSKSQVALVCTPCQRDLLLIALKVATKKLHCSSDDWSKIEEAFWAVGEGS